MDPKNDAFCIYAEFGPALRIARQERLEGEFPQIDPAEIATWIVEFKELDRAIWKAAECGGGVRNGRDTVGRYFQERFPWLEGDALNKAISRSDYYAWHDGYHDNPMGTL